MCCQDPTELGTMVSGVNCSKCKYGYLLPRHPLDYNSVWDCSDCDNKVDNETIATKLGKYEDDIENMEKNRVIIDNFEKETDFKNFSRFSLICWN